MINNKERFNRSNIGVLLTLFTLSIPAYGMSKDHDYAEKKKAKWLLRGMLIDVKPINISSNIAVIGGKVETPEKRILATDISYFITESIALGLQVGRVSRDYVINNSQLGSFKAGKIVSNSVSLTAQYHVDMCCHFFPYLEAGLNHTWTHKVTPAQGIPQFEVKPVNSSILGAGFDYLLSDDWYLSSGIKYVKSPEYRFKGHGFNAGVKMDTLITSIGIAYLF